MSSPSTWTAVSPTQRAGQAAEDLALDYLLSHGLRLVARNWRVPLGEVDLVMRDGAQLVFVEVRRRGRGDFGGAAASVGWAKQARLRRTASAFLAARYGDRAWPAVRFDVVAIEGAGSAGARVGGAGLDWIRAAF